MELCRLHDPDAVARAGADLVARALARDSEAVLVLPAGSTPLPLFRELERRVRTGALELERAHVFQLDELVGAGPGDPTSFHAFLVRELLGRVARAAGRDHLLDGRAPDAAREIRAHADELARLGGPRLVLLGLGTNGHVAFNEPGTRLADGARVVELAASTRAALPGEPARGLTLGLAEIAAAEVVALLVTGRRKADVLARLVALEPTPSLPASLLRAHRDLVVLADEDACALLGA